MSLAVALTLGAFLHASSLVLAGQATDPYTGTSHTPMHGQHVGRLDLNSASLEELQHVPGINEATAKKIVENRPYARADDLITKKVLSKTAYDGIKDHIAVTKPAGK
jgi:DNA uptake protein ComE-like DNA-binding protein